MRFPKEMVKSGSVWGGKKFIYRKTNKLVVAVCNDLVFYFPADIGYNFKWKRLKVIPIAKFVNKYYPLELMDEEIDFEEEWDYISWRASSTKTYKIDERYLYIIHDIYEKMTFVDYMYNLGNLGIEI